jgi:hypothetical protein
MRERDPRPMSFLTLDPGTSVVDRFGRPVGEVQRVLLHEDGAFDGIIVRTPAGRRFVDAPEVRRISRGAVMLGITVVEVEHPAERARAATASQRRDTGAPTRPKPTATRSSTLSSAPTCAMT